MSHPEHVLASHDVRDQRSGVISSPIGAYRILSLIGYMNEFQFQLRMGAMSVETKPIMSTIILHFLQVWDIDR